MVEVEHTPFIAGSMLPNTVVKVIADGPYNNLDGVIIKSDPRIDNVCVDLFRLNFPVWFSKGELVEIGKVEDDVINRHIWDEIRNPY